MYNLSNVNDALEVLGVSKIPESRSQDSKLVEDKIKELGMKIRTKLEIPEPNLSTGEKVMEQFTSNFNSMNKTDKY